MFENKIQYTAAFFLTTFLFAVFPVFAQADPNSVSDRRAKLEEELAGLEKQIEGYRSVIIEK